MAFAGTFIALRAKLEHLEKQLENIPQLLTTLAVSMCQNFLQDQV